MTSLQDAAELVQYPELSEESLRLEMFFQFSSKHLMEVIVLGERLSNVQDEKLGTVAKIVNVFEFPGSYKYNVIFLGFSFVMVSVLSVLFFFGARTPEKNRE